jgi:hypothetical protein
MKTIHRIRPFALGSVLLAAAVGLALTATGCVVDPGPGYGSGCQSDLYVDWQIQNETGGLVTCDAAGAATVVISFKDAYGNNTDYPQKCEAGSVQGSQDILLQSNYATYNVTVTLEDPNGAALAVPQTTTVNVTYCGSYETPGPAILVYKAPTP